MRSTVTNFHNKKGKVQVQDKDKEDKAQAVVQVALNLAVILNFPFLLSVKTIKYCTIKIKDSNSKVNFK